MTTAKARSVAVAIGFTMAGCHCSGDSSGRDDAAVSDDGGPADAGAAFDASTSCLIDPLEPPPAWTVEIAYDVPLEDSVGTPDFPVGKEGVWHVFADGGGVSVFTRSTFLRTDVNGTVVGRAPFPDRVDGAGRVFFAEVAKGADGFGAVATVIGGPEPLESRFCTVGLDGGADLAACAAVGVSDVLPQVLWAAGRYRVFSTPRGKSVMRMSTHDEDGVPLATADILPVTDDQSGIVGAAAVGDKVPLAVAGGHTGGCSPTMRTATVQLSNPSVDASLSLDLLQPRFRSGTTAMAASPTGALLIIEALCLRNVQFCSPSATYTSYATAFGEAGEVTATKRVGHPGAGSYHLVWDGERYALLAWNEPLVMRYYDAQGTPVGTAQLEGLAYADPVVEVIGETSFAAVGPGEYVVGYAVGYPTHFEHRLARVVVAPP